jgi:hypothetical protein
MFDLLILDIDAILQIIGKRWVFVFDQIHWIFKFKHAKMVGDLDFPFHAMKSVMKPGRIISIISASVNNEASYKDHHDGFEEYIHTLRLERNEIKIAIGGIGKTPNSTQGVFPCI